MNCKRCKAELDIGTAKRYYLIAETIWLCPPCYGDMTRRTRHRPQVAATSVPAGWKQGELFND